jgi:adenosylhomocysteine nucleosidase
MTRIAIIAAMPGELKPLVRGWHHERHDGVHLWRNQSADLDCIAACAGAGIAAATRAFAEAEKHGPIDAVISVGWVGALRPDLVSSQVYPVSSVLDARTGERFFATNAPAECLLVTAAQVVNAAEKQRLATAYKAHLVDMEAAAVARLAQMRAIPFYCIKGISDGYTDQLPDFNRFISPNGQFRAAPFILFALLRPWHWRALARMGENSSKAARGIAVSLLDLLDEFKKTNGDSNHPR